MRSAILLAFVALYGCATAPGYRSSSVRPPEAFREDPHPLSPSSVGRGGTKDEPPVSSDYWDQLSDTAQHLAHQAGQDRKSTRLNSSHEWISYAVFCLKKKKKK